MSKLLLNGAIPGLLSLVNERECADLVDQAIWGLGNLAGDGPLMRDHVINQGAAKPIG